MHLLPRAHRHLELKQQNQGISEVNINTTCIPSARLRIISIVKFIAIPSLSVYVRIGLYLIVLPSRIMTLALLVFLTGGP